MKTNWVSPLGRRCFLGVAIATLTSITLVGGCGSASSDLASTETGASGETRLTFWTMQLRPTFDDYMADLIRDFEAAHPGTTVNWVDVPWGDMEQTILTAIAAGTGPDVANLNPQFASKLAEREALLWLDDQVSADEQAAYFPRLWQANQLGDRTFGLPWYVATDITVYNQDLLTQANLDPEVPPTTYAELATWAATLKETTGTYALLPTMDGGQILEAMVQMGLTLLTPEGEAGFDNEAGRAAFGYWVDLFQAELIPREVLTEGHQRALELYQAGELAFLITGPQLLRQVQDNAPAIAARSAVSPQIVGPSGINSASVMNVVVPRQTEQPEVALDFALFLTNSDNQLAFAQLANTLPSTVTTAEDTYFQEAETDSPMAQARVISASQLAQAEVLIPPVEGLDQLQRIIYEELQLAMLGRKSVDEAVTSAAQRWQAERPA